MFYTPDAPPTRASVIGAWNGWSTEATPLLDTNGDGTYQAWIDPGPGRHTYLLFDDGHLLRDPYNPLTLFEDGQDEVVHKVPVRATVAAGFHAGRKRRA